MPTTTVDVEQLSALYDRIYDIADRLIKKHNPCNIHIETKTSPNKTITNTYCNHKYSSGMLCCYGCKYWDRGCTIKSLGCKLFLCQSVKNKMLQKRFQKLRNYGRKHLSFDYWDGDWKQNYSAVDRYYRSKEQWLKQMENSNEYFKG